MSVILSQNFLTRVRITDLGIQTVWFEKSLPLVNCRSHCSRRAYYGHVGRDILGEACGEKCDRCLVDPLPMAVSTSAAETVASPKAAMALEPAETVTSAGDTAEVMAATESRDRTAIEIGVTVWS
jgi:hypothetical protein